MDVLALDPARIAAAVHALVVVADDGGDEGLSVLVPSRATPASGWARISSHSSASSGPRLVEHRRGDGHLADVVQEQAEAEGREALVEAVVAALAAVVDPAVAPELGAREQQAERGDVDGVAVRVLVRRREVVQDERRVRGCP